MRSAFLANASAGAAPAYNNPGLSSAQSQAAHTSQGAAEISRAAANRSNSKVLSSEKTLSTTEKRAEPGSEDRESEKFSGSEKSSRGPDGKRSLVVA